RSHVIAPDQRRLLPSIATAIADEESRDRLLGEDNEKVDIGAIDLGKAFMVGFACRRHDRKDFVYTIKANTKAVYQPLNKARGEAESVKQKATITQKNGPEVSLEDFELSLVSLAANPIRRILQEHHTDLKDAYTEYSAFHNKHGRHQKRQAQAQRARR
ncbi:hypothetical protein DFQ27_003086, partial [Actinomortierella ambigua]